MRYIISQEGNEAVPWQYITSNALTWDEEARIPIGPNYDFEKLLGYATDIRREGHNLTAEIVLFEDVPHDTDFWCFSTYLTEVEYHRWKDVLWITKGHISALALIPEFRFWPNEPMES